MPALINKVGRRDASVTGILSYLEMDYDGHRGDIFQFLPRNLDGCYLVVLGHGLQKSAVIFNERDTEKLQIDHTCPALSLPSWRPTN